ncbi:MAG TPA: class F sortase [Micromonosporaceae bacterium]|jgi:hypothetical protein|nr:class F sortase [Micromonosporaceae bacterium]
MAAHGRRLTGWLAAGLVLAGVFLTGTGLGKLDLLPGLPSLSFGRAAAAGTGSALAPSRPVRISIPAIGVRAPVNPVGLAEDGSIATPSLQRKNEAGWYERGPTPGQYGPAIIVGHVDGTKGPAVFHKLGTLRPGQLIEVVRRDRRVAIFQVDEVATYDKASLPTKKIYGDFSRPGLRVITCGGQWVGGDLGYAENVVVFASLVRTRKT